MSLIMPEEDMDVRLMADLKPTTRYMVLADIDKSLVFSPDSCKQEDDCEGKMMIKQTSPHRGSRSAWRMTCWRLMTSQRRLVIRLDLQPSVQQSLAFLLKYIRKISFSSPLSGKIDPATLSSRTA